MGICAHAGQAGAAGHPLPVAAAVLLLL